jgi:hypothetical protein
VSDKLLAEERKINNNNNKKKRSKHNMSPKLCLGDIIMQVQNMNLKLNMKDIDKGTLQMQFFSK